ncbi:MAG: nitroreductase family protein, partial [Muribaculum sp.]|nr:nitroreductase family protein [Muribaculum sp.]
MTSFHDLITNRRSIRKYTDEEISADDVKTIMEAALMAPTSKSSRPWQFVIVEDAAR